MHSKKERKRRIEDSKHILKHRNKHYTTTTYTYRNTHLDVSNNNLIF